MQPLGSSKEHLRTHRERTETVFVVDDDLSLRRSLAWLLESSGLNVRSYPDAEALLADSPLPRPGCLILDVRLPGMGGLTLQDSLAQRGETLPVLVVSGYADVSMVVTAFKRGAVDFIEKPFDANYVLERVRDALDVDRRRHRASVRRAELDSRFHRLTLRERQVMELAVAGMPNKLIGYELGISMKTVEVHRSRVMQKLEVATVGELVRLHCAYAGSLADDGSALQPYPLSA
jgi:two-component system response regulator FixJ